ncbi:dTDP-4-dehydrorhamnose reductase [Winogradskyella litorisediminis]|uniref:dTDP-4-dehydrorhamnose reductase n=1 Tax=Winogradskyella litorisediminis TaxID=1156618 RepID=A0ABW3N7J7_9FLAO
MISVLVTGKDSQLALCLKDLEESYPLIDFTFRNSTELDITSKTSIAHNFKSKSFDYCVNCAAYTAVDKAESEPKKAKLVNTIGAKNLALACKKYNTILIHISTDFVFDGKKNEPYLETDITNPINTYGKTKRDGEIEIVNTISNYIIIRTSWLYSQYGNNFVKTVLRLSEEKKEINVVNNQFGSPTYAMDLANFICEIIDSKKATFGIFHFANIGCISWFDFAKKIKEILNLKLNINPVSSINYQTTASRPNYSVLYTSNTRKVFDTRLDFWTDALQRNFVIVFKNKSFR